VTEAEEKARNKAVVTEFFERMNAGDLGRSFSLLADDCAWISLSSRKFSGKEQMRAMIAHVNLDHPGDGRVWLLIVVVSVLILMSVFLVREGPQLARCARVCTGSDRAGMASFRAAWMVRAGHDGAGRPEIRCQQVTKASLHRQSRLIFRVRRRAWRTSLAGTCHRR
jgi:hypothetical protein